MFHVVYALHHCVFGHFARCERRHRTETPTPSLLLLLLLMLRKGEGKLCVRVSRIEWAFGRRLGLSFQPSVINFATAGWQLAGSCGRSLLTATFITFRTQIEIFENRTFERLS
jgi:hypothetical protein